MKSNHLFICILIIGILTLKGCDMSPTAQNGDKVKVHYVGTLEDGSEFDSSRNREPLEFTLGEPGLIEGFTNGVIGMKVGEVKKITLPPDQAYQLPNPALVQVVPRESVPENITPEVGLQLTMQNPNGQPIPIVITAMDDSTITIDANHPLAGKTLNFELELVEIVGK
jgi:peptidylprolyl isomerase